MKTFLFTPKSSLDSVKIILCWSQAQSQSSTEKGPKVGPDWNTAKRNFPLFEFACIFRLSTLSASTLLTWEEINAREQQSYF